MARLDAAHRPPRRSRLTRRVLTSGCALLVVLASTVSGGLASAAAGPPATASAATAATCQGRTVTAVATADTWLDENSPSATKGGDSVLNVNAGSVNVDTGLASGRMRALVRFPLPSGVPSGCVVESAKLQLFSLEGSAGTKVEVVRLASTWSEAQASWSNQPGTKGDAVRIWSRGGPMRWNVTPQVEAMLMEGPNHGFVVRDAAEGAEEGGSHGFYGREKGEFPPELVITFAAPPSTDPPGDPAAPVPTRVRCGQVLTQSTLVTNDLSGCPGDGLVVGADRIIVDLDGHLIDGVGLGSGILNDGHDLVTVRNGRVQDFDYGVQLPPETTRNTIQNLTLRLNQVAAVELFDVSDSEILGNTLDQNGGGIALVSGTRNVLVADNAVSANGGAGLLLVDADDNRLENNTVEGGGDLGIGLERASGNTLLGNTISSNSDGGIEISEASHNNLVESNTVTESGDHGILVRDSDGLRLISNVSHRMSDSGITLDTVNDSVVRGNDVRFNTGGLQVDGSSRNVLEANDASSTSGIGIELGGGSFENDVVRNTAVDNGAQGIYVADDATDVSGTPIPGLGNLLRHNVASANLADGIVMAKGGHTLTANTANANSGWGINAGAGTIDGRGNVARANLKPEQCVGVMCKVEWDPPETTITDGPDDDTNSAAASLVFSSTEPGSFQCRLDGEDSTPWSACSSPRSYTGLAEGSHTFEVRATDLAGNTDPTPATATWTIDTTAPQTTIDRGPADPNPSSGAALEFSATDAEASFECALDDGAFISCTSPLEYAGLAPGHHTFRVRATDAAGNTDLTPAIHAWTVQADDTTPPQTTIDTAPADPTNDTSAAFTFTADETGSTFECALDGADPAACDSPVRYPDLSDGSHTFEVRATDLSGNTDPTPATATWTIDTTAPQTALTDRPADPTTSPSASFAFTADEAGSTFECSLDRANFVGCASGVEYAALAEGSHTFEVRATDPAGNTDPTPASYSWTVQAADTTPPQTTIETGPADPTTDTTAAFTFAADETGATFECSLDTAVFTSCTSPGEYTGLVEGVHTLRVRATDQAGNTDPTPATHTWTIQAADTTPPQTTIDTRPDDPTTDTTAAFTFAADEAGSTFECSLDAADFTACTSPRQYTELAVGSHTLRVRATDQAGNTDPTPATHTWTIQAADTTPPQTTIDTRPDDPTTDTTAAFTFTADELGSTFECSLDTADFTACTSPRQYTELAVGSHTLRVRATDQAGNTDPTPATHTWTIQAADTTPPQTTIDTRPDDPTTDTTTAFTFTADEKESTFECSLDGAAFERCATGVEYTDLAEGTHTFEVRATDAAGNTDPTPATHTWTIDTTAPQTSLTERPDDSTTDTTALFGFSADEAGSTFTCSLDGASPSACDSPIRYADLSEGTHTFEVRATDRAGNTDPTPASHTWTIDTTAPQTSITDRPDDPTTDTTATFTFSADEAGSTFECSLDAAEFTACTSPHDYAELAEGTHAFEVRATDAAGNTDPTPATHTWIIDTTAPQTTIDTGPDDPTTDTTATFTFTADEAGLTFECSLDGAAFGRCASGVEYADLSVGTHALEVRATDRAGNTDPTPAAYTWTVQAPDTTPPQTTISSAPPAQTTGTTATFAFTADELGSTFECSLDAAEFTACTSPRQYAGLAAGTHTFRVRATDADGNTDATPSTHTWTIQAPPSSCASSATAAAVADAWLDQNSPTTNKGSDSILKTQSKAPSDNFRALVRFNLPTIPPGCVLDSARLRLFTASTSSSQRMLHVLGVGAPWTEGGVTWANQPATTGGPVATTSGRGYREWSVAALVQQMYASGANNGFLIKDADEGQDAEQQFHAREKGESVPQLVLSFTAADPGILR